MNYSHAIEFTYLLQKYAEFPTFQVGRINLLFGSDVPVLFIQCNLAFAATKQSTFIFFVIHGRLSVSVCYYCIILGATSFIWKSQTVINLAA